MYSTSEGLTNVPVGLLGEHRKIILLFDVAIDNNSETLTLKSDVRRQLFISTPAVSAATLYMPYVGSTVIIFSPGATTKRIKRSMISSEPLPANIFFSGTSRNFPSALLSLADLGSG